MKRGSRVHGKGERQNSVKIRLGIGDVSFDKMVYCFKFNGY